MPCLPRLSLLMATNHGFMSFFLAFWTTSTVESANASLYRALGELAVDRELTVVNQLREELDLLQFPDPYEIEYNGLFSELNRESAIDGRVRCILILRASTSSRTSSILSVPVAVGALG